MSGVINHAIIDQRIAVFNGVRDLPYHFNLLDPFKDQSCRGKAGRLVKQLREIGLVADHICCRFYWKDTFLPQDLLDKAPAPESQHWFVRVTAPEGNQMDIDPTWDSSLEATGFQIAKWNGHTSTSLAVKPFALFSVEDSARIWGVHEGLPKDIRHEFVREFGPFYDDVNKWFASQRRNKGPHA